MRPCGSGRRFGMMRPGAACAAVGVIAATTSAVGHRVLIDGSDGSARAGHSATMHYCIGLGASVAVSDSRFAAGPGSQTITLHMPGGSDLG